MLSELHIENFAIIPQLDLKLSSGLTAFTGETGAGKSIILDAITAVVGGKVDAEMVRRGADRAVLEAVFTIPPAVQSAINQILEHEGLLDDSQELSLAREIRTEGRSIARVNGRSVNQSLLRDLGSYLVDIHGQSEHLSLLNVRMHLNLLDRYANCEEAAADYRQIYQKMQAVRRSLEALKKNDADAARLTDLLIYQAQEIESALLKPGEEDELRVEMQRLSNAENLANLVQQSLQVLDESSPDAPSLTDLAGRLVQAISSLSRIDASQAELYNQAESISDEVSQLALDLRDYAERIEFNPARLEQIGIRLDLIQNLKRKYGGSEQAAIDFAANARRQLESFATAGDQIAELDGELSCLYQDLAARAEELSEDRRRAASEMSTAIENELADLQMSGARFEVSIQRRPDDRGLEMEEGERTAFDATGIDQVEFLISPNAGEGLKPLVKIASGGETSRLMLALKNVLARADTIPTLIFDEIDQGIGGRVGALVGEKLWKLARDHQVMCVTHLPQLAAFGDQHLRVEKQTEENRTRTYVTALDDAGRVDELATMFGGANEANRAAARETFQSARRRAQELLEG
ncbi:MAG: DNA repair protein RecN [Anaerolineaceae bacterium]